MKNITPGAVFQDGTKWRFSFFVNGYRRESTQAFNRAGQAKQAMRARVTRLKDAK